MSIICEFGFSHRGVTVLLHRREDGIGIILDWADPEMARRHMFVLPKTHDMAAAEAAARSRIDHVLDAAKAA